MFRVYEVDERKAVAAVCLVMVIEGTLLFSAEMGCAHA